MELPSEKSFLCLDKITSLLGQSSIIWVENGTIPTQLLKEALM